MAAYDALDAVWVLEVLHLHRREIVRRLPQGDKLLRLPRRLVVVAPDDVLVAVQRLGDYDGATDGTEREVAEMPDGVGVGDYAVPTIDEGDLKGRTV